MRALTAKIAEQRYGLYYWPGKGYSTEAHGPFETEAAVWAAARLGLVEIDPTGGAHGSVKITDAGREALKAAAP